MPFSAVNALAHGFLRCRECQAQPAVGPADVISIGDPTWAGRYSSPRPNRATFGAHQRLKYLEKHTNKLEQEV